MVPLLLSSSAGPDTRKLGSCFFQCLEEKYRRKSREAKQHDRQNIDEQTPRPFSGLRSRPQNIIRFKRAGKKSDLTCRGALHQEGCDVGRPERHGWFGGCDQVDEPDDALSGPLTLCKFAEGTKNDPKARLASPDHILILPGARSRLHRSRFFQVNIYVAEFVKI